MTQSYPAGVRGWVEGKARGEGHLSRARTQILVLSRSMKKGFEMPNVSEEASIPVSNGTCPPDSEAATG